MGFKAVSLQLKQREKMCVKRTILSNVRTYQRISFKYLKKKFLYKKPAI